MTTLKRWLTEVAKAPDTPYGDFVRDARSDRSLPDPIEDVWALDSYLASRGACAEAREQGRRAFFRYEEWLEAELAREPRPTPPGGFEGHHVLEVAGARAVTPEGLKFALPRGAAVSLSTQCQASWLGDDLDVHPGLLDEVNRAALLLETAPRVRTPGAAASSYGLKHTLEDAPGQTYICNGATIVACHLLGIRVWSTLAGQRNSPNPLVGVSWRHGFGRPCHNRCPCRKG